MPKRKASPKKLSELQRKEENYCFGGCAGPSNGESISGGVEGISNQGQKSSKKKSKKLITTIRVEHIDGLDELLEDSDFYVPIRLKPVGSLEHQDVKGRFCLGYLNLEIHDHYIQAEEPLPLHDQKEFWLYVSRIPGRSMIYFEWFEEDGAYKRVKYFTLESIPDGDLYNISPKVLFLELEDSSNTGKLVLSVNLRKSAIISLEAAQTYDKRQSTSIQKVMTHFYNTSVPDTAMDVANHHARDDTEALYAVIKSYHEIEAKNLNPTDIKVQHANLQVQLRPYQIASVHWMLRREALLHSIPSNELHPLYKEIAISSGDILYYNIYLGVFVDERPTCKPSTPGGILADEMGLGKTVEVLSCLLANPRTDLPPVDEKVMPSELNVEIKEEKNYGGEGSKAKVMPSEPNDEDGGEGSSQGAVPSSNKKELPQENGIENSRYKKQEYEDATSENIKEETIAHEENISNENETSRRKSKRCVRFADHGPAIIDYVVDSEEEDTSDASWDEKKGKPKTKAKKVRKTKKQVKKPVKRLKEKQKSILKPSKKPKLGPIEETIENVIKKYCANVYASAAARAADEAKLNNSLQRKKACQELYNSMLSEYSAVKVLQDKSRKQRLSGFFKESVERKSLFECICGAADTDDGFDRVKCSQCSVWQHTECVRFNKSSKKVYFCPHCWQLQPAIPSRATLIVAPASISPQWMDEIHKLIVKKGIKVEFYSGVHGQGFIQPQDLANNDIVITSYETLCKELDYVDLPHCNAEEGRRFRNAKRYMALPSPLPCIQWWRVCLDEAQMVECTTTRTAEMALRLAAVHRWCITGTPVQKSITDVFGLIMFLGVDPYCQLRWWLQLLQNPYRVGHQDPLHKVICPLMWRTSKVDVLDQICIPDQTEQIHWIHFSPVEEHFYRRQHVQCANIVLSRIAQLGDLDTRLQMLRKDVLTGIISPLLSLRQACCHPQAVKGQFISLNKTTLTMEELLTSLIKKARVECEESFRQVIAALNGLAGVDLIREQWRLSVEKYREVLMLIELNKDKVKTDKLQRIHTLHNLAEVLESHSEGIPRTLRDSNLREEAKELETNYLNRCIAAMKGAKQSVEPQSLAVIELSEKLELSDAWWSLVLQWAANQIEQQEVVERIRQALQGGKRQHKSILYNSVQGLESLLLDITDSLDKQREDLLVEMQKLETMDPQTLVNLAVECHLRTMPNPDGGTKKKKTCPLCTTSELFEYYEKALFREEQQRGGHELVENVKVFGKLNRITWAEGEMERILKALLGYAKLKKVNELWIQDGSTQIKLMEVKKKEFKHLRTYWRQLNDHISALDELNMCKLRLRLKYPFEPALIQKKNNKNNKKQLKNLSSNLENKVESIYIIEGHEVETHSFRLATERSTAQGDFRRRMGQLQYLENLQRDGLGHKGGFNPELCPICRKALGVKWSVLLCGHCYCIDCLQELTRHQVSTRRNISCPVCRETTNMGEISYVNTKMQNQIEDSEKAIEEAMTTEEAMPSEQDVPVALGRNSAKAEAVVLCLKNILAEDIDAKALVFSTWQPMLLVLARAFRENSISFAHMETGKKLQESLKLFKDPTKKVTALLLPVHSGSKGLNLIEATHVLLVEPILNPASELQALGRVHRIGQTKQTVVHRFVVRGTIEERMHVVLKGHKNNSSVDEDPVKLQDLFNMFSSSSDSSSTTTNGDAYDNAVAGPSNAVDQ